ncbi:MULTISPECIES: nickel ABC transporter permease [Veillonella]|uniref:Nickel import system permease protein NikB n=2 Tax=Veillonella TaxID=29465 RepID=A0AAJ1V4X7_9FIRM|nr:MULTISPECIES: nickel ABC transporter permease [Veillonella]MDK7356352.1 ABC transporter permease [Veillonella atypica]GCL69908.1 peptide ABC transporter permease [Veillonella tobetsuensis]
MGKRFVKQLGQFIVTLFGITFLTFCLTYLAPGDPVTMLLETADTIVSQELIDETRAQLGLDKPFIVQYANWVVNAAQGDLGMSYSAKKPVVDRMLEALPGTVMLAGTSLVFTLLYALPAGIISALNRNKWIDYLLRVASFVGVSMPSFWLGLVLIYIFGLKLGLVPIASSRVTPIGVILPAVTLAVVVGSKYMRQVRLVILEEMQKDYVIGARARGVSEMKILFGHILPNAVLPLITILGVVIGWLLGGVAVIEMVFSWPGLGNMAVYAITMRDYPLIEGFVLWVALAYMCINALVDASYILLDPRLKRERA